MSGAEIPANIVGILAFGAKVATFVYQLTQEARGIPEHLEQFNRTLKSLCEALEHIGSLRGDRMTSGERELLHMVDRGSRECFEIIKDLDSTLPGLRDHYNVWKKVYTALELRLKDHDIQEKIQRIHEYRESIHLTLTVLSIKKITKVDGNLEERLDQLFERIDSHFPEAPMRPKYSLGQVSDISSSDPTLINDWGRKIREVTREATPTSSNAASIRPSTTSSAIVQTPTSISETPSILSISAPHLTEINPVAMEIVKEALELSNNKVEEYSKTGYYLKAAMQQQESIRFRRKLKDQPLPFEEEADMIEKRVLLLLQCSTVICWKEALSILRDLLEMVEDYHKRNGDNQERLGRLHYLIAQLLMQPDRVGRHGNEPQAFQHSKEAFELLVSGGFPPELEPAARLHIALLRTLGRDIHAEAITRIIDRRVSDATLPRPDTPIEGRKSITTLGSSSEESMFSESSALDWCREIHFDKCPTQCAVLHCDPYSDNFRFDDPLDDGLSPFHRAIRQHKTQIVEKMVAEVDPNSDSAAVALLLAAETRRPRMAEILLRHGTSVDQGFSEDRTTALHVCQRGDNHNGVGMAELLLKHHGELVNMRDEHGRTALYLAYENSHQRMASMLLEYDADPRIPDLYGKTCLHLAVEVRDSKRDSKRDTIRRPSTLSENSNNCVIGRRAKMVQDLLDRGINPNVTDNYDKTPLYLASAMGDADTVRRLLAANADVNGPAFNDETPLIAAARGHHVTVTRVLMAAGAQTGLQDCNGRNAFYYASGPAGLGVLHELQGR